LVFKKTLKQLVQYFVVFPLAAITVWILMGMASLYFLKYSWQMLVVHRILISAVSLGTELMSLPPNFFFIKHQQFLMGFRSGLLPGQSMTWKGCPYRNDLIHLEA
jgi:hypothetical protein